MKVLVADDSAVPRLILERNLTALGHEIASAVDGDEAWALYQSFAPSRSIGARRPSRPAGSWSGSIASSS